MTETKAEEASFAKYAKVKWEDIIDCPDDGFPISPAVGYCRWCGKTMEDAEWEMMGE